MVRLLLLACVVILPAAAHCVSADESVRLASIAIYDSDPQHLWNRVYTALMIRLGPDGKAYGQDRLEPLLWDESTYLLAGEPAEHATKVLDEFLAKDGELLITDPTKRALLQRDLWMVANWLARKSPDRSPLFASLLRVIHRLGMSADQIAEIPDNYAATVAANRIPATFDSQDHERPYLPSDLLQSSGPWVCVGRTDGRTAPLHLQSNANNATTNSVFLVFVKFPSGRQQALDFIAELVKQKRPLMLSGAGRAGPDTPNPDMPQLPEGTELALVRRAMLIDNVGHVVASPITESVQLRVIRKAVIPKLPNDMHGPMMERAQQTAVFEFRMSRQGESGRPIGSLEDFTTRRDFKTGFASHAWDEFERKQTSGSFPERSQTFLTQRVSCLGCHTTSSIYSTMSFQRHAPTKALDESSPPLFSIAAMSIQDVERTAIRWKERQPGWLAIQKQLADSQ